MCDKTINKIYSITIFTLSRVHFNATLLLVDKGSLKGDQRMCELASQKGLFSSY